MGRTLPSVTQIFLQEQQSFARFRRALRRSDQQALDDLFAAAQQHIPAASYASHALPFEVFLLAMLLEEHKEVMRLRHIFEPRMDPDNNSKATSDLDVGQNSGADPNFSEAGVTNEEEASDFGIGNISDDAQRLAS